MRNPIVMYHDLESFLVDLVETPIGKYIVYEFKDPKLFSNPDLLGTFFDFSGTYIISVTSAIGTYEKEMLVIEETIAEIAKKQPHFKIQQRKVKGYELPGGTLEEYFSDERVLRIAQDLVREEDQRNYEIRKKTPDAGLSKLLIIEEAQKCIREMLHLGAWEELIINSSINHLFHLHERPIHSAHLLGKGLITEDGGFDNNCYHGTGEVLVYKLIEKCESEKYSSGIFPKETLRLKRVDKAYMWYLH